ncbi:MAG: dihydrodipicolinate synthase family protein [Anaerolineales bacterium]|nr:MAG: dihydrodipicolinate synthase family protein [Anaerolineales bacterium]
MPSANLTHPLSGVYTAAVTPLTADDQPDLSAWAGLLSFFAQRGAHGALLLGTTGEGTSFSAAERVDIFKAAAATRPEEFRLLAGTGTPSLTETIALNQAAFDAGFEAVVVLPPYFMRNASEDGLFDWFSQVIERSVPEGRWLLGYHIPAVSGVPLPLSLLQRLQAAYPTRFAGLKDSTGDQASAAAYAAGLPGCAVLVGNDKLMTSGMQAGAAGCITALANLRIAELRAVYEGFLWDTDASVHQATLDAARSAMDSMPPAPAYLKAMLHSQHGLPLWPVRSPLRDFSGAQVEQASAALKQTL